MKKNIWWGDFKFVDEQIRYWRLGSCLLMIARAQQEWRVASHYLDEIMDGDIKAGVNEIPGISPELFALKRFGLENTLKTVTLTPVLADRPQVSRPEFPFYIPAQEQATLYVSSPAWIQIQTGDKEAILQEIPTLQLSDTWFGANTQEGELCYASRTRCLREFGSTPLHPYRVTSMVTIQNHARENLFVQRIKLPLPSLSVFADQDNNLWTENIVIENDPAAGGMIINIEKILPEPIKLRKMLSSPRLTVKSNRIISLFSQIL